MAIRTIPDTSSGKGSAQPAAYHPIVTTIEPLAKIDDSLTTRGNPAQTREKRREYADIVH
jgi:hypothetical protein